MADPPRILHISGDFPDPLAPEKTRAIANLLELTAGQFDHRVISLNRIMPGAGQLAVVAGGLGKPERLLGEETAFDAGVGFTYAAPPKGLFHKTALERVADALHQWLATARWSDWRPDLIIGHKLTIEGVIARRLSQAIGVPFALSLQGNTDTRITAARPDLKLTWQGIFHEARVVFPFAPWTLRMLEDRLGSRSGPSVLLPCATDLDTPLAPQPDGGGLVSVFNLAGHRWKNLHGMAGALKLLAERGERQSLAIIGGGEPALRQILKKRFGMVPGLNFEGQVEHRAMQARLNRATGLVLPSLRESFGMVFVEALFAGLPMLYSADRAVDGYFDGLPFAIRVDPRDTKAIADGMARLVREEAALKAALAEWQQSEDARRFTRPSIAEAFAGGLRRALQRD